MSQQIRVVSKLRIAAALAFVIVLSMMTVAARALPLPDATHQAGVTGAAPGLWSWLGSLLVSRSDFSGPHSLSGSAGCSMDPNGGTICGNPRPHPTEGARQPVHHQK
jgi:hypothetical protein